MSTYEEVHAGAVVLGHDGNSWGVEQITHEDGITVVTLVRHGARVAGYPPAGTEVTVIEPADVSEEARAAQVLIDAFGSVELIGEIYSAFVDHPGDAMASLEAAFRAAGFEVED